MNVGERTNVTGSARFKDLISEGDYEAALEVARQQVENGAQIIDVNMDEGMLEGVEAMARFLDLVAAEPDISRVPVMIDSSRWSIIEAGLKRVQGKAVVNSISLKEGEEEFVRQALLLKRYGAAVIVMAFDERGQADTKERKVEICKRAYRSSQRTSVSRPRTSSSTPTSSPSPPVSRSTTTTVSTSSRRCVISSTLPHSKTSGGISNVSFSFRGNNPVREAIHAVFLYHAIRAGLTMGIVNAGQLAVYDEIDSDLREAVEDVVLNRRPDSTERLLALAEKYRDREDAGLRRRTRMESLARREEARARAGQGHSRVRRGRYGGGAPPGKASARCDRRPAYGRDERRRRPVRLGQDVPAAGRKERPRDEEGRRLPHTFHRGEPRGRPANPTARS